MCNRALNATAAFWPFVPLARGAYWGNAATLISYNLTWSGVKILTKVHCGPESQSTKNRRRGLRFFTPSHVGFHFGLERRQWLCTTHWHASPPLVSSRKPCNLPGSVCLSNAGESEPWNHPLTGAATQKNPTGTKSLWNGLQSRQSCSPELL